MENERSTNSSPANESFLAMAFERAKDPHKRRWSCPGDEAIGAYVDGKLRDATKTRLENHLAKCERCRSIVADVIKLQRDVELPVPPSEAANRILVVSPRVPIGSGWIWMPAAAMVLIVVTAAMVVLLQRPQRPALLSPPTSSAPIVAKVEPLTPGGSALPEITRQPIVRNIVPVILSPSQDSTVNRTQLEFTWKPLERSSYYNVTIVTSDGNLLWAGKTKASSLRLPREIVLKHGSYFVWITAYLTDGQVAKSSPVKFLVDR